MLEGLSELRFFPSKSFRPRVKNSAQQSKASIEAKKKQSWWNLLSFISCETSASLSDYQYLLSNRQ